MTSLDSSVAGRLVAARWLLLGIGAAILAVAWPIDQSFQFDRRIEQLFPEDDPALVAYQQLQQEFGGNEIAVLTYPGADLYNTDGSGIEELRKITAQVEAVAGVRSVLSLAKVSRALGRIQGFGITNRSATAILGKDKLATAFRELFTGYTHSRAGDYAALVIMLDPDRPRIGDALNYGADQTVMGLRRVADSLPAIHQPTSLVGEPVLVDEGFSMAEADGQRLGTVTLGLLSLVMLAMFRSPKWVIAQWIIIFWSTVVTRAVLGSLGLKLTLVSSMLTAVVTVVAVASIIHLAVSDRNAQARGYDSRRSTRFALSRMLRPIVWACLTDAVGFASLVVSDVGPVRDFGIMMAVGALVVLVAIVLFVPAVAAFRLRLTSGNPDDDAKQRGLAASSLRPRTFNRTLRHCFYGAYKFLYQHKRATFACLLLLSVGVALGLSRLQVETNFIRNFRENHRLAIDYGTVENHLEGAGVWDVLLPAPQTLTTNYINSVLELEDQLRAIGKQSAIKTESDIDGQAASMSLTKVLSIADADLAARANIALSLAPPSLRLTGMREAMPHFVNALLTAKSPRADSLDQGTPSKNANRFLRIMMRSQEHASAAAKRKLAAEVSQVIKSHTSTEPWRSFFEDSVPAKPPEVTGYSVLLTGLVAGLARDQWTCFAVAAIGVWLMLLVASRSWRLSFCAMIPNVLPILGVIAALGLLGVKLNLGTAMIAAVSIGISIDGSIHFLTAYRRGRQRGHGIPNSICRIYRSVGVAVVLATVSLVIGFSTLITSPFVPTSTFGLLVSTSLVASSIANLTLLPWAIRLLEGPAAANSQS